ncbi:MAG: helix-turn-helix transcriptional regulator [Candidatus Kapaibacterium sp.]
MNSSQILARNLRSLREKLHLTQEAVAYKAKLTPGFIGRIERSERTVSVQNLDKIARVLKIETYELLVPPE